MCTHGIVNPFLATIPPLKRCGFIILSTTYATYKSRTARLYCYFIFTFFFSHNGRKKTSVKIYCRKWIIERLDIFFLLIMCMINHYKDENVKYFLLVMRFGLQICFPTSLHWLNKYFKTFVERDYHKTWAF